VREISIVNNQKLKSYMRDEHNRNVIFGLKNFTINDTLRYEETNGLAFIFARETPCVTEKKREVAYAYGIHVPIGYIWNSSFPSYFASPLNRRTILLYVAGFGMKFSLLLPLVKMPEIVKMGFTLSRRRCLRKGSSCVNFCPVTNIFPWFKYFKK